MEWSLYGKWKIFSIVHIEKKFNKIDGAVCKVNLKKKTAKVSYSKEISDEILKQTIENAGFEVKSIV